MKSVLKKSSFKKVTPSLVEEFNSEYNKFYQKSPEIPIIIRCVQKFYLKNV